VVAHARRNIDAIRKCDVTVRLARADGTACAGETVEIEQLDSAFAVGDHLWPLDRIHRFGQFDADRARAWRWRFEEVFNAANALCYWTERPRNDGPKIEEFQGEPRMEGFTACVDWAASRHMHVKGHPLFWSIPKCIPDWVQRYDVATLMKFAEVRVRNLVARFRGRVGIWDAINEPLWEASPAHLKQRNWPHLESAAEMADYIEPVLRWCREEDPDAAFLVNDYGLEQDPPSGPPRASDGTAVSAALQRRRLLELVRELADRGSAPDALGMQAHTAGWLSPAQQWAVYDELSSPGLPLHVTEFWADIDHLLAQGMSQADAEQLRAEYASDYLTCAFGHRSIDAFFFWGFMDQAITWGEYSSHELRPMYARVRGLLREEWRTRLRATSDAEGIVRFRGFPGQYAIRCGAGPARRSVRLHVSRQSPQALEAILPRISRMEANS
jgi:endo-1,4-beta-xylanase